MIDYTISLGTIVNLVAILSFLMTMGKTYRNHVAKLTNFVSRMGELESKVERVHKALMGNGDIKDTLLWRTTQIEHDVRNIMYTMNLKLPKDPTKDT